MKASTYLKQLWIGTAMLFIMAVSVTTATYAWFTSNRVVVTDKVSGRSDTDMVSLLIGESGGDSFQGGTECRITRVNAQAEDVLMPVSTADLKNFVYNDGSVEDMAVSFEKAEEEYYYHGRVYLKAESAGHDPNQVLALYLDGAADRGNPFKNAKGNVLNSARLGLEFVGENKSYILRAGEDRNNAPDRAQNTSINGVVLGEGQVIDSAGGVLRAVNDPSISMNDVLLGEEIAGTGAKPLLYMELNKIYQLDLYIYLEGCDPDCTESVAMDEMDLQLAFYGVLTGKDGQ